MEYVKDSRFYRQALQVINRPFGTFYLFESFVIGEVNEGVLFSWEHQAKEIVEYLSDLYDQDGKELVYISNRVHQYSINPSDWLKFYKAKFHLCGYAVVNYGSTNGVINSIFEKLFMRNKIQNFNSLENAVYWAKELCEVNKGKIEFASAVA